MIYFDRNVIRKTFFLLCSIYHGQKQPDGGCIQKDQIIILRDRIRQLSQP